MFSKKTKIVATIGPASTDEKVLISMINAGMNVTRLNFSHGDHQEHGDRLKNIISASKKANKPVAILQDLSGPKIRIGDFDTESIVLKEGSKFTLTTDQVIGNKDRVFVNYPLLPKEIKVGSPILIHDGKKRLEVIDIKGNDVICRVIVGGEIKGRRGVNLPGAYLSISSLTEKDKKDLVFGIKNKVDFIALSFVRRPSDIVELKDLLKKNKSDAQVIAKIETPEAVDNIDEIINLADGIMVARGDLAIEIPAEDVPLVQKNIIKKCHIAGKPVIVATQMLESMISSPVATRAEVSDVANAILDGTDAVMLSEETALGLYPIESVALMSKVARKIESSIGQVKDFDQPITYGVADCISDAVAEAACHMDAKFVVALTNSGFTARMLSRHRPNHNILALTPNKRSLNKLCLSYGCVPVLIPKYKGIVEVMKFVKDMSKKYQLGKKGDIVVIAAGMPFGKSIDTNMMLVETL